MKLFKYLALCLYAISLPGTSPAQTSDGQIVDQVAVVIDNRIITLSDIRDRAGMQADRLLTPLDDPVTERQREKALKQLIDTMISEKLILNEVRKLRLEATPSEIEQAISDVRRQNNMTDEQLREAVKRQGLNFTQYRAEIKRQLERAKVVGVKVRSRIKITDEDIRNYYTQNVNVVKTDKSVHVRHILLLLPSDAPPEGVEKTRKLAEEIRQRILGGEDFAELAQQYSDDPSRNKGGDLGFLQRGMMVPEFEEVVFKLKEGEISQVVRTEFGFHIIQALELKQPEVMPLEEVKDQIRSKLYQQALEQEMEQWLEELKRSTHIDIKLAFPALEGPDSAWQSRK